MIAFLVYVLTIVAADADQIDVPSFWQSVALALAVEVVGMLAVFVAAFRLAGA